jgi:hypothetical protein
VPVRVYAAHTDEDVAVQNAYRCQQQLTDHGHPDVSLVDLGRLRHLESGKAGLAAALRWFGHVA